MRSGEGLTAGVPLPAVFAVGLAFFGDTGRGDAFFALFLMIFRVFLAALRIGAFFRFPLAFTLVFFLRAITASWHPQRFESPIVAE